jgi:hypothetical protein
MAWAAWATAAIMGLLWWRGRADLRPLAMVVIPFGALISAWFARRRRWSDEWIALYIDRNVEGSDDSVTTYVTSAAGADALPALAVVADRARVTLERAQSEALRPVVFGRRHLHTVLAALVVILTIGAPPRPQPALAEPPIAAAISTLSVASLERVGKVGDLPARDPEQKKRLEDIAKEAKRLREDMERGISSKEALDRLARLRDAVVSERMSAGSASEQSGVESAARTLAERGNTQRAGSTLADHEMQAFDDELEKLANSREEHDREIARQSLQSARETAAANGAGNAAKSLGQAEANFGKREERASLLRELAKGMDSVSPLDGGRRADSLDRFKNDRAAQELAEAMEKELAAMTPEERERLARNLAALAQGEKGDARADAKDLADSLNSDAGKEDLRKRLRQLAEQDLELSDAARERGLRGAEKELAQAEGQGAAPVPSPQSGSSGAQGMPGAQGQAGQSQGPNATNGSSGGKAGGDSPGGTPGPGGSGAGAHDAPKNGPLATDTMTSKAHGDLRGARLIPGTTTLGPGMPGGKSTVVSEGDLRAAAPGQLRGVLQSDVPEDYREQVRQYFEP